jgi:hypothetical protein
MNLIMPFQIVLARESLSTFFALLVSYPFVAVHMILQYQLPRKVLPANRARMRRFRLLSNHIVEAVSKFTELEMEGSGMSSAN